MRKALPVGYRDQEEVLADLSIVVLNPVRAAGRCQGDVHVAT